MANCLCGQESVEHAQLIQWCSLLNGEKQHSEPWLLDMTAAAGAALTPRKTSCCQERISQISMFHSQLGFAISFLPSRVCVCARAQTNSKDTKASGD